jgi:hypothetical protein
MLSARMRGQVRRRGPLANKHGAVQCDVRLSKYDRVDQDVNLRMAESKAFLYSAKNNVLAASIAATPAISAQMLTRILANLSRGA